MSFKSWTTMVGGGLLFLLMISPAADSAASGQATCGDLNITYSPTALFPPNHKLQTITITATDNDEDGDNFVVQVDSITSNQNEGPGGGCGAAEGSDFTGVGNTASGSDPGTAVTSVQVRAERCAEEGDRVYDIKLSCSSTAQPGGCTPPQCSCSGSPPVCECVISCTTGGIADDQGTADLLVTVPHDQADN